MDANLDVTNARIVLPETGVVAGTLVVRDGRVAAIRQDGGPSGEADVLDAQGRHVLPGLIDPHVHSGLLPPLGDRLQAESAFALSGGITTIVRYFRRPESYLETLPAQVELGARRHYQDFAHHLTLFNAGQVAEMDRYVRDFGVTSFKLYMNLKGPFGKGVLMDLLVGAPDELTTADVDFSDGHLWDVFRTAAALPFKVRINIHSEDAEIVMTESARVRDAGLDGLPAWSAARPGASEAIAIGTVGYLSRRFGVPVYFPHIGSREAIEALVEVRAKGTNYGAEVCPQYVALTTESDAGTLAKVMPPVRTSEDVPRVWWAIGEGVLTSFGSDHIAYTLDEKQPGSIWTTRPAFGGTGMILPVFLSEGVNAGRMTIRQVAEMGSLNTARLFNLYPRKGTLQPGSDADFVVVDLEREWTVRADENLSRSDFSVYEGRTLRGAVTDVAVRGTVMFRDGKLVGEAGHGRYYRRFPTLEAVDSLGA
ncbi:MAG TPA: amidohydrolase family protein [Candidatus Limnocylindrales bacterium]|nr:amidohydrolase family protein [Candidatus Limnocylindrales bacterium]